MDENDDNFHREIPDEGADKFVPPDRPDQIAAEPEDRATEVDVFEGEQRPPLENIVQPNGEEPKGERDDDDEEDDGRRRKRRRSDDDDEEEDYSKRVRRRINREISLRRRVETRLEREIAARQRAEERLARLEKLQQEIENNSSVKDIEQKIKEVTEQLAQAKEAGETQKELELTIKLTDLQAELKLLRFNLERNAREQIARDTSGDEDADDTRSYGRERSSEWIRANRRWWNTTRWAAAKRDAIAHDKTILEEIKDGTLDFEPYSDEHFEELSRRLKADYPELDLRTIDGDPFELDDDEGDDVSDRDNRRAAGEYHDRDRGSRQVNGNGSRRAPMGGLGGRDGRRERSEVELAMAGKVRLTEDDFRQMRIFGLDPNNPEHKKRFAKERMRTILAEARNAGVRR